LRILYPCGRKADALHLLTAKEDAAAIMTAEIDTRPAVARERELIIGMLLQGWRGWIRSSKHRVPLQWPALCPEQRPPILDKLVATFGLPSPGRVDAIRYTFHAELSNINVSRSWIWEPKTDRVTI
jgi:hypothetical protein